MRAALIPGNTFHTARVVGQRRWFLGASTEWPGVEKVDVEIGDVEALAAKYPDVADDLRSFGTRLACWRARLAIANFSGLMKSVDVCEFSKDRFGATPKPACETHALPRNVELNALRMTR